MIDPRPLSDDEIYGSEGRRVHCFMCGQALTLNERCDGAILHSWKRGLRHECCPPAGTHPLEAIADARSDMGSDDTAWWKDARHESQGR